MKLRLLMLPVALTGLGGCSTLTTGGAPAPAFSIEDDMKALAAQFNTATSISAYYTTAATGRVDARNRFIAGRLVQVDLQYLQFIRALTSNKQRLDTAADVANLTLSLAGTLVGGARAKTNLAAAVAGLSGAKTTIDKEYFYEQSMDALVATMNAKRKEVLVKILRGLNTSTVEAYPFEVALTQLNEYYLAGTINGALRFINFQAAEQENKSDAIIEAIPVLTPLSSEQRLSVTRLSMSLMPKENPKLSGASARRALELLGNKDSSWPTTVEPLTARLQAYIRAIPGLDTPEKKAAEIARLTKAFEEADLLKAE